MSSIPIKAIDGLTYHLETAGSETTSGLVAPIRALPPSAQAAILATAERLTTIIGHVDGLEAAASAANALNTNYIETTLASQSGASGWSSEWMDVRKFGLAYLLITWTAVASTSGAITVQGTVHPAQSNSDAIHDLTSVLATVYGTGLTVGATAGAVTIPVSNTFPYLRCSYTRVAGGGAAQFQPYLFGRVR